MTCDCSNTPFTPTDNFTNTCNYDIQIQIRFVGVTVETVKLSRKPYRKNWMWHKFEFWPLKGNSNDYICSGKI